MSSDPSPRAEDATTVVITAKNASATIARSAASALAQTLVTEVVVVDDGSTDDTARVAQGVDDGSGRLKVIHLPLNCGPAHGRNVAIAASTAPLICILDADDFMSPGRVDRLVAQHDQNWDLIADDIAFTTGPDEAQAFDRLLGPDTAVPCDLTLGTFARGNLRGHARFRRELGFLKPVMRRSFLDRHSLRYDERLRLGEDFVLMARCLLGGARFRLVAACGYFAVQTPHSLSGSHSTEAIGRFQEAVAELVRDAPARERPADLIAFERSVRHNHELRRALDAKRAGGWWGLCSTLGRMPSRAAPILAALVMAKLTPQTQRGARDLRSPSGRPR